MGDYNPSTPSAIGMEWQPYLEQSIQFSSPNGGFVQRIRPGAITLGAIHRYHSDVLGSNPGIALEVVDTLAPTIQTSSFFPGSDDVTTGWYNQGASTTNEFQSVDDKIITTDYIQNSSAIQTSERRTVTFKGTGTALASKRIAFIAMTALVRFFNIGYPVPIDIGCGGVLKLSGNSYYQPERRVPNDGVWYTPLVGAWRLNPATNLPWTMAQVNNIVATGGTDAYGLRIGTPRSLPANINTFWVAGLWVDVVFATENRIGGFYYDTQKALRYWQRFPLTSASALSANTWYWLVEYPLIGGSGNYARSVYHVDPKVVEAASGAAVVGEHRESLAVTIQNGIVTDVFPDSRSQSGVAITQGVNGSLLGGVLLESTGPAVISQSNPYVLLERKKIASDSPANIGQSLTTAAATTYTGVQLPVAWNKAGVKPDQSLVIELRHGAGAQTGAGTLDATATLYADQIDGTLQKVQIPFAASYLSILNQQYFLIIKSNASTNAAWDIIRLDTHSDQIDAVSTTTVANIEGASQGGQTDGYTEAGTSAFRYDVPIDLISTPLVPAGLAAAASTPVRASFPPRVTLSWNATALTTNFGGYKIYRRPNRTPVASWALVGFIQVNPGQTAATVEANHLRFIDYEAGVTIAGGQWSDGWDYMITVVHASTGQETFAGTPVTRVQLTPDADAWITSNMAPWLNTNVFATVLQGQDLDQLKVYKAVGRNLAVTRARAELPGRQYSVSWELNPGLGEDAGRAMRAAAASGRQVCLTVPQGDRVLGSLGAPQIVQDHYAMIEATSVFVETSRDSVVADYNLPAGLLFNGSTQALTVPDATALNPSAGFTFLYVGTLVGPGAVRFAAAKGNLAGGGNGYGIGTDGTANELRFYVKGASATAAAASASAGYFDGNIHCVIGWSTGTSQALLVDGVQVATSTVTHGAVTNAIALSMGADNAGTTSFMNCQGSVVGLWNRVLTTAELAAATGDGLLYPNTRMPGGAALFLDLRDKRCWNGINLAAINDLAGSGTAVSTIASPIARGLPWPIADLEKF